MRFICLGYADERAWDAMSPQEQSDMMEECLAFDEVLHKGGHVVAVGEVAEQHERFDEKTNRRSHSKA